MKLKNIAMRVYYCQKFFIIFSVSTPINATVPSRCMPCAHQGLHLERADHVPYMGSMHNICYGQEMKGKWVHVRIYIKWF